MKDLIAMDIEQPEFLSEAINTYLKSFGVTQGLTGLLSAEEYIIKVSPQYPTINSSTRKLHTNLFKLL